MEEQEGEKKKRATLHVSRVFEIGFLELLLFLIFFVDGSTERRESLARSPERFECRIHLPKLCSIGTRYIGSVPNLARVKKSRAEPTKTKMK